MGNPYDYTMAIPSFLRRLVASRYSYRTEALRLKSSQQAKPRAGVDHGRLTPVWPRVSYGYAPANKAV
eukprot:scaffold647850_cov46-Prasinocladus_malaysianus.AAC.7